MFGKPAEEGIRKNTDRPLLQTLKASDLGSTPDTVTLTKFKSVFFENPAQTKLKTRRQTPEWKEICTIRKTARAVQRNHPGKHRFEFSGDPCTDIQILNKKLGEQQTLTPQLRMTCPRVWFQILGLTLPAWQNLCPGWVPLYPNMRKSKLAFIQNILKTKFQSYLCYSAH